jgi:hypothetical protein
MLPQQYGVLPSRAQLVCIDASILLKLWLPPTNAGV